MKELLYVALPKNCYSYVIFIAGFDVYHLARV